MNSTTTSTDAPTLTTNTCTDGGSAGTVPNQSLLEQLLRQNAVMSQQMERLLAENASLRRCASEAEERILARISALQSCVEDLRAEKKKNSNSTCDREGEPTITSAATTIRNVHSVTESNHSSSAFCGNPKQPSELKSPDHRTTCCTSTRNGNGRQKRDETNLTELACLKPSSACTCTCTCMCSCGCTCKEKQQRKKGGETDCSDEREAPSLRLGKKKTAEKYNNLHFAAAAKKEEERLAAVAPILEGFVAIGHPFIRSSEAEKEGEGEEETKENNKNCCDSCADTNDYTHCYYNHYNAILLHAAQHFTSPPLTVRHIEELIDICGAKVSARDAEGATPLHWAASRGLTDVVVCLLDNGADKEAKDSDGLTPLDWASSNGHAETILLLRGVIK